MELKQMRYFLALAQEGNFSRAAERLHMAQPPLTRQIQAIEEELGAPLFVRISKGVELTEAGQALLAEVPNILALAERSAERTRLAGKGFVGRLEVGTFGSSILNVVPRVLLNFHKLRPEVGIGLHSMARGEQIRALRERHISVGFARLVPDEPDLVVEMVQRESLLVALYEGHPLCDKAAITVRDLDNEPLILYPNFPAPSLAQRVIEAFRRGRARLKIEQQVDDVVTAVALVASGFGLCITTESGGSLRLPGVVYRPLRSSHFRDLELSCFYRRDDSSPVLNEFLVVLREYTASRNRQADR